MDHSSPLFTTYRSALIGLPVSLTWRGHGSAIFLELGTLRPQVRRDGSAANPRGEFSVIVEWGWRIENEAFIICGSDSDSELWETCLGSLTGQMVQDVSMFGHLPELVISLTGGFYVCSFMTSEGDPHWAIIDQGATGRGGKILSVKNGLIIETEA